MSSPMSHVRRKSNPTGVPPAVMPTTTEHNHPGFEVSGLPTTYRGVEFDATCYGSPAAYLAGAASGGTARAALGIAIVAATVNTGAEVQRASGPIHRRESSVLITLAR